MTAAHETNEIDGPHEGPIKTPKQLILAVLYAFVVPIFGIILLVMYVTTGDPARRPAATRRAPQERSPSGSVRSAWSRSRTPADVASMKTGEQVFAAQCTACHADRRAQCAQARRCRRLGVRASRPASTRCSTRRSPARARCRAQGGGDFSDFEIGRAVVYMANQGGAKFPEPAGACRAAPRHRDSNDGRGRSARRRRPARRAPRRADAGSRKRRPRGGRAARVADAGATPPPLYTQVCTVCHAPGVAGAPKIGDKAAWAPRLAQGVDGLMASVVKGKGAMPPQGRHERERRRDQDRRHLDGRPGQVSGASAHESAGLAPAFLVAVLRRDAALRAALQAIAEARRQVGERDRPRAPRGRARPRRPAASMSSVWTMP